MRPPYGSSRRVSWPAVRSRPGAHGYHLEFVLPDERAAGASGVDAAQRGVPPKRTQRKGRIVLYYKDFEAIVELLTRIGAFGAVLHLEDVRALRETKNRIHRLVNTEAANLRTRGGGRGRAAPHDRYLAKRLRPAQLSPALREIAELRLEHPDESLAELGRRCNPPIAKPTVSSRLWRSRAPGRPGDGAGRGEPGAGPVKTSPASLNFSHGASHAYWNQRLRPHRKKFRQSA